MSVSVSFPWKLVRTVKVEGKDNNLLELIAADPAFNLTLEELQKTMDPTKYVGRAKEQTESIYCKRLYSRFWMPTRKCLE